MIATQDTMTDARAALGEVVPELVRLVRNIPDPNARAIGTWRVADVAAHVTHVFGVDTDAVDGRTLTPVTVNTANIAELTEAMLADDTERDPAKLADRIETMAHEFDEIAGHCDADTVEWLGGALLPPSAVVCHLLEECLVHGHDIAQGSGQRWPIQRRHAALAIEGAAMPIITALPTSFVNAKRAGDLRARVDINLRGGGRQHLVLDAGALRVEDADTADADPPVDARISADPAALLLVLLGREKVWRPLLTGKLLAWGRRPWKLLRLLKVLSPP